MEKGKKMINLDNHEKCIWPDLIKSSWKPPPKVCSAVEISDDIVLTALSFNFLMMAIVQERENSRNLYVIDFIKLKYFFIWEFDSAINAIKFEAGCANRLIVASQCGKIYFIDIIEGEMQAFEDHSAVPIGIECSQCSNLVVTWSKKDALLWLTPVQALKSKLRVDSDESIIWVCHISSKSSFAAGFNSGTVLIWDELNDMKEYAITPKEEYGAFNSYTVCCDGELIVGGGSIPYLVVYSISNRKIIRTIHISDLCPTLIYCQFVPAIHTDFSKVLLLLSVEGTVVMFDCNKCEKIKCLRSQNYSIRDICINEEGDYMAITYDNGHTKLYQTLSFFPRAYEAERSKSCDRIASDDFAKCAPVVSTATTCKSRSMTSIVQSGDESSDCADKKLKIPLDKAKWLDILDEFKEFPQKYRRLIWTSVLELPLNSSVVGGLLRKEFHPGVEVFQKYVQTDDTEFMEHFSSTVNCLLHWAPCLASVPFLADFVSNFVLLFKGNSVHCFELCATVIHNWCRTWFECWPEPPIALLHIVEQIICENNPELLVHLMKLNIDPEIYAWSLLSTGLSKVLSTMDYLIVWDNIFANPPSYIISVVAAYTLCLKKSILSCSTHCDVKQLYQQESWLLPTLLLKKSHELYTKLKMSEKRRKLMDKIEYLPKGGLLPFSFENRGKIIGESKNNGDCLKNSKIMVRDAGRQQTNIEIPLKSSTGAKSYEDCLKKISSLRKKQVNRNTH